MRYSIPAATLFFASTALAGPLVSRQESQSREQIIFPYTEEEYASIKHTALLPIFAGNSKSLDRLTPSTALNVYLGDPANLVQDQGVPVNGQMQFVFRDPTVGLDGADTILKCVCSQANDKISITFDGDASLNVAKAKWSTGVVLLDAYGDSCGEGTDFHFKKISGSGAVESDGKTITFPYKELNIEDALMAYEAGWGKDHKEAKEAHGTNNTGQKKMLKGMMQASGQPKSASGGDDWPAFASLPDRVNAEDLVSSDTPSQPVPANQKRGGTDWDKTFEIPGLLRQDITFYRNPEDNFRVFCKGCGIGGHIRTSGHIAWDIKHFLTGNVVVESNDLYGHLEIALQLYKTLHTDADRAKLMAEISHTLSVGLPGLSLGGVITIGPSFDVIPFLNMQLSTTGTISMGGDIKWDNVKVIVDISDHKKSLSQWSKPTWSPFAKVEAHIAAVAQAGVRFGFKLGVTAFNHNKGFSLMNEAYIQAKAEVDWTAVVDQNGDIQKGFQPINGCTGVNFDLELDEHVYIDIDLIGDIRFDLWRMPSYHLFDVCWPYQDIERWFDSGHLLSGI